MQHDPPTTPPTSDEGEDFHVLLTGEDLGRVTTFRVSLADLTAEMVRHAIFGRDSRQTPVTFHLTLPTLDGEPTEHVVELRDITENPHFGGVGAVQVNLKGDEGWDHGEFTPLVSVLDELLTTWLEGVDLEDEHQLNGLESRVLDWLQAQADTLIDHGQRAFEDRLGYERTEVGGGNTGG